MWSERSKKTRSSEGGGEVFWVWKKGTQEVGMFLEEREEQKERGGTTAGSMGEGKRAQ